MTPKKPAKKATKAAPAGEAGAVDEETQRILREFYLGSIEAERERIEAGDGDVLLNALHDVCLSDAPMPYWLSVQVASAVRRYTHMHVKTLDEAFGVKKRVGFAKLSKRRRYGMRIYFEVCALHSVGVAISKDLYKAIAEQYPDFRDGKIVEECYTKELRRRGGVRFANTQGDPERLPDHLKPIYEAMTGKRIRKRV
ncbi:MAG: hypothetical protein IAE66_06240 [Xanthomonadaceae bacterium]|nr:hypothetical protein [Xanthomonadaceae bacterium]